MALTFTNTLADKQKLPQAYVRGWVRVPLKGLSATAADTFSFANFFRKGWVVNDLKVSYQGTVSATLSLGVTGAATRFLNALATAADGITHGSNVVPTIDAAGKVTAGTGYQFEADADLLITIGGANVALKDYVLYLDISSEQL